jgi:hypothetical protein
MIPSLHHTIYFPTTGKNLEPSPQPQIMPSLKTDLQIIIQKSHITAHTQGATMLSLISIKGKFMGSSLTLTVLSILLLSLTSTSLHATIEGSPPPTDSKPNQRVEDGVELPWKQVFSHQNDQVKFNTQEKIKTDEDEKVDLEKAKAIKSEKTETTSSTNPATSASSAKPAPTAPATYQIQYPKRKGPPVVIHAWSPNSKFSP